MHPSYSLGSLLSVHDVIKCARMLDSYKANTLWIPETWGMECFAMLGAVSQALTRTRLGSSIINVYSRSPSLVAMGAVTADTLSGGRFVLGLGASTPTIVRSFHGAAYDSPLERIREYVEVVRLACSGERIEHKGRFFSLSGFQVRIKPIRPQIPIYLAAVGPRMLELATEVADGAILYLRPIKELSNTVGAIKKRNPDFDVACQIITAVSQDEDAAINRAKSTISFYVSVGRAYREFLAHNGYAQETRRILAEYERTKIPTNPSLVPDSMVHELAICGTPESCPEQLRRFSDSGVLHPILQFNPVGDVVESFRLACSVFSESR